MMTKLIAFDFDGTIINSLPNVGPAIIEYSKVHGLSSPDVEVFSKGYMDPLNNDFGWKMSPEAQAEEIEKLFLWWNNQTIEFGKFMPIIFDGAQEMLNELKEDYTLAIVTSRNGASMKRIAEHYKIDHIFQAVRNRDDIVNRGHRDKPHPDMLHCVMDELGYKSDQTIVVGDTCADMNMASNAGAKSIAVTWGYQDKMHLEKQSPTHIVDDMQSIVTKVKETFSL